VQSLYPGTVMNCLGRDVMVGLTDDTVVPSVIAEKEVKKNKAMLLTTEDHSEFWEEAEE